MKGVILAGGRGTRLEPLTGVVNKHLLPLGKEPMIWHPVKHLVNSGIKDILIVTSVEHMGDMVHSLGSGNKFGCRFTYRVQEEAGGIAHALSLAEEFAQGEKLVVLLGDNVFEFSLTPHIEAYKNQREGARVLLKKVKDPRRYGVAKLKGKKVVEIEEKPDTPQSNYAVVGCYLYDHRVFDYIRQIRPSRRGELEITAVNNRYIQSSQLQYGFIRGRWTDAGTFESWFEANRILFGNHNRLLTPQK